MAAGGSNLVGELSPDGLWRWDGAAWRPVGERGSWMAPQWLNFRVRTGSTWAMVASALGVGLLTDQAFRSGAFGLAAAAAVGLAAALLAITGGLVRLEPRIVLALAAVFGFWLAVRASPWLVWPDLAASLALLGFAASTAVDGSLFDAGSAELSARALRVAAQIAAGAAYIGRPIVATRRRLTALGPLARGLVIALPICVLLAVLLASADPVFASFFNLNLDFGRLSSDIVFVLLGGLAMAGLFRAAAAEPAGRIAGPAWRLGATEVLVVLTLLDALFAAFALAQVLAASGAAAQTLRSAGVSYSDYARSGFFQLLWAGGITLAVLILFSRITALRTDRHRLAFLILAQVAGALTLMIVVVAYRRLSLYEEAYGFTMLRLYSHIFAVWMALVFALLGAEMLGIGRRRRWFVGATAVSAFGLLLILNIVNPEALVVALNADHANATGKLDAGYLAQLSSDATPAVLAAAPAMDPALGRPLLDQACAGPRDYAPSLAAFSLSGADAAAARAAACPTRR